MSVATVNDHLYAMAGVTVTAYNGIVPDVYYAAPLTITGNITQWQVTRALPRNIFGGAAVTFGGQIYDIGGALDGISDATDKVFAAFEQPTGGVLTWIATTGITPSRLLHTAVMNADGWIYVIGGSTGLNQPIQQNIVNVGATTGESGSAYVDHGTFTSDPFDLEKNYLVRNVSWVTELSDPSVVTLTLRFRYRLSSGAYTSWSPLHPANFASGVSTTTVYLSDTARYLQYQAFFTTTDPLVSPILQSVKVTYETPEPPEFYKYANPPSGSGVKPGDRITYTLTYSNAGDSPLTHVIISDTAPISTSYVAGSISSSPPVTMHAELAPRLFWDIGTLPGHSGGTLGFIVIVGSQVQEGDEIQNTANLDSDTIAARSTLVYHTIGVPPVLIKSHVTSAPAQTLGRVQPGDLITYTLMYSNPHTTLPLSGAIITDVLPLSVTYLSSFGSIAPDLSLLGSQRIIRWSIGTVPTRTSGTVGYAVQVVSNVALVPDGGAIVNTAQLGASGRRTIESQDSVPVRYRFDRLLSKSDGLRKARPGDSLTYTIRLTNVTNLPVTATGIVVHDYLEPGQPGDQPGALQCVSPCPGWSFVEIDPDGIFVVFEINDLEILSP